MLEKIISTTIAIALALAANLTAAESNTSWIDNFSAFDTDANGARIPKGWKYQGKPLTTDAKFMLVDDCVDSGKLNLRMEGEKCSGMLGIMTSWIDLDKTPILRWKWRVLELPKDADGLDSRKDDQAISIYVGSGRLFQKSVSYRWETETRKGTTGNANYGGGFIAVKWECLRNKDDGLGKWFVEERNVRDDLMKNYGYVPKDFGVSVSCNSQYTASGAKAELAWIELVPENSSNAAMRQ